MIQEEVERVRSQLDDEDVPIDSLTRLRDRLVRYGDTRSDSELMHVVHQLILLPSWMRDALYDDLEDQVKDRLSNINSSQSEGIDSGEVETKDIPLEIKLVKRELNRKGVQPLFDTDYGKVQQSPVIELVANALEIEDLEASNDDLQRLSSMLANILQNEFDELEKEYQDKVEKIYDDIIENVENSEKPVSETRNILEKHNQKWHTRAQGWPGNPIE